MTKEFWISLPVRDVKKSRAFFTEIGFKFNKGPGNTETSACLIMGTKSVVVMLFEDPVFKGFTHRPITDANQSTEVLLSFDAESREEVDEIASRVEKAGGVVTRKPGEAQGYMYGFNFADIDGHQWNVLYMDMSKIKS